MTLPVVRLSGEPFEQGRQHGLALRERIARNIEIYYDRFSREADLPVSEVRERTLRFVRVFAAYPEYDSAIRGVAAGSDLDFVDIVMLNARYELLYYQYSVLPVGGADGCSSFALLPSETTNAHLLMGQNWDWIPEVQGAVLHTREPDGLQTLTFTEAGIPGSKFGLNSAGLGLAINGLLSTSDDWSRQSRPFHARCYELMRRGTLSEATSVIEGSARACSANFVLAQPPDHAVNVEAAPDATCEIPASRGMLTHTNHFIDPVHLGIAEPASERRPHSHTRLARMRALLEARRPVSIGDLEECLRDHDNYPDSICRHDNPEDPPEEACVTVVSAIMDLDDRALWLTDGHPCERLYERVSLNDEP